MKILRTQLYRNSTSFQSKSKIFKFNTDNERHVSNSVANVLQNNFSEPIIEDNIYRSNILRAFDIQNVDSNKIKSILGPNETKKLLLELNTNEQNFIASDENINTGKFIANLHIHTSASDGYYSPKELLEDARIYADKVFSKTQKPFTIAITDHDTIDGYSEIIKEVAQNSDKYKNLKIILGMESTTYEEVKGKPIQFHMLVYNIDPSDKKFKDFLLKQCEKKHSLSKYVIHSINKDYNYIFNKGNLLSEEEFLSVYPPIKKGLLSAHNYLRNYAMTKFIVSEIILKLDILKDYFKNTNPEFDADIEMKKIIDFQYNLSHNNSAFTPFDAVSDYYSKSANIEKNELAKQILNYANNSDKISNFIKSTNSRLYEHRNINNQNFYVNISDVYNSLSNQPNAILGIAHPLSVTIDKINNDSFDVFADVLYKRHRTEQKENKTQEFLTNFYNCFKEKGKEKAKFSEVYYQSYHSKKNEPQTTSEILKHLFNLSKIHKLLKTGGYDSHRRTIFARY